MPPLGRSSTAVPGSITPSNLTRSQSAAAGIRGTTGVAADSKAVFDDEQDNGELDFDAFCAMVRKREGKTPFAVLRERFSKLDQLKAVKRIDWDEVFSTGEVYVE